jgi:RNA polymerase sigma factor (sigma-70 family)
VRRRRFGLGQPPETDVELIELVRGGDDAAFGELYRRHRKSAAAVARSMVYRRPDVDDVVSEAFAGVLAAIRNGRGPRDNFSHYLFACVRNGCRVRQRLVPVGDVVVDPASRAAPAFEDPERYVEADTMARAFASLRPRWQQTLWLADVEQRPSDEVSRLLELSPNAAAALTMRAREALATAYLAEHLSTVAPDRCAPHAARLAAYVRGQLTVARHDEVSRHVDSCEHCEQAVDDLRDLNGCLRSLALPAALAASARTWPWATVSSTSTAAPATGGATLGAGVAGGGGWAGALGAGIVLKAAAVSLVVAQVAVAHVEGDDGVAQPAVLAIDDGAVAAAPAAPVVTPRVEPAANGDGAGTEAVVPASAAPSTTAPQPVASATLRPAPEQHPPTPVADAEPAAVAPPPLLTSIGGLAGGLVADLAPLVGDVIVVVDGAVRSIDALLGGVEEAVASISTLVTIPPVAIAVEVPAISLPAVTVPAVPLPPVTLPPVTLPAVTVPPVTVPGVDVPPVTLPIVSIPLTVPPTVPPPTLPEVTVPPITLPEVTLPEVTLPAVTLPPITVPPITLPPIELPPIELPLIG